MTVVLEPLPATVTDDGLLIQWPGEATKVVKEPQTTEYNDGGMVPKPLTGALAEAVVARGRRNGKMMDTWRQERLAQFSQPVEEPAPPTAEQIGQFISSFQAAIAGLQQQLEALAQMPGMMEQLLLDMARNMPVEANPRAGRLVEGDIVRRREWCNCSPSRGDWFRRYTEWPEPNFAAYRPPGVYADSQPGPSLASEPLTTIHRWDPPDRQEPR